MERWAVPRRHRGGLWMLDSRDRGLRVPTFSPGLGAVFTTYKGISGLSSIKLLSLKSLFRHSSSC